MLRISQIRLRPGHSADALTIEAAKVLKVIPGDIQNVRIRRKSVDARKKFGVSFIYTLDVSVANEKEILEKNTSPSVTLATETQYQPGISAVNPKTRPVIVGAGPAGLFAGLILAENGFEPIILERGKDAISRARDVYDFWKTGRLDTESNVQFGLGGAGTFSDGKLTTGITDKFGRVAKVLDELVRAGSPEEILYLAKPHIGTNKLVGVVTSIAERIAKLGGQIHLQTKMERLVIENGKLVGIITDKGDFQSSCCILATGHSGRDNFFMLKSQGVALAQKPFAVGLRIEHKQSMIDQQQYGQWAGHETIGAAEYKLVHHVPDGRAVYSFCMCPGGEVIGASNEPEQVVTNGMSNHARSGDNANSALLVNVRCEDFGSDDCLAGIEFQRKWERRAFEVGGKNYFAPAQQVVDFLAGKASKDIGSVTPTYTPGVTLCDLSDILPKFVIENLKIGLVEFEKRIPGFSTEGILTGPETRSSSPVRVLRDENLASVNTEGLFCAGEGAGYAGGIMSAAVDGIKAAESAGRFLNNGSV